MSNVVHLNRATRRLLSKKQLAEELNRSTRWLEIRMREGLPVEPRRSPNERARFDLEKVQAWMKDRAGSPTPSLEERVRVLERALAELRRTG